MGMLTRREFTRLLVPAAAALATPAARAGERRVVTVLTSYPDTVISKFQDAFERTHSEYRLSVQWRMPFDALPYLERPKQSGVDVYWAASPRNFDTLARQGALRKLDIDLKGLPSKIGNTDLMDPGGRYISTEMAGYGFVVHPAKLEALHLPLPTDWTDLTQPAYAGQIALPDPVHVGFAPVMIDIVLQQWGWSRGWAIWSELAANSKLVKGGDTFITDEVAPGDLSIGLTIDFFAVSAIAKGAPLQFIYPKHTGVNPAQVAITASAPNVEGASRFVEFVVSDAGQKILADPTIRKLPVRPSVYAELPTSYFDPFKAAAAGQLDYDGQADLSRLGVVAALFGVMLSDPHAELTRLWARVHAAERKGIDCAAARSLLCRPPIDAKQAQEPTVQKYFFRKRAGESAGAPRHMPPHGRRHVPKTGRKPAPGCIRRRGESCGGGLLRPCSSASPSISNQHHTQELRIARPTQVWTPTNTRCRACLPRI